MKPTDILSNEHRIIELVLDSLETISIEFRTTGKLEPQQVKTALDFFRNFADCCHHAKEENLLFPAMEARGFSRNDGPTGVMLYEHEQGRAFIRGMAETFEVAAAGSKEAGQSFLEHADNYLELLRQHIQKEDHCLFAMADNVFDEEDNSQLLAKFAQVEAEEYAGAKEKYQKIAINFAKDCGIEPSNKLV